MTGALVWAAAFMAFAAVGALAGRRFAHAIRASGGTLLTDEERQGLFWKKPVGSVPAIVGDDLAGFQQLLRRQGDPTAERWRRVSIGGWAVAFALLVLPLVSRAFRASGAAPEAATPNFITPIALIVAAFWGVQLVLGIIRGRSPRTLLLCVVGIIGGMAFALGAAMWLG